MFPNLEAEMARKKMTKGSLAKILNKTPTTISLKLSGKAPISLEECVEIKNAVNSDCTLDYLFATGGEEDG